jgi:predicted O-linked N-acetylglucosamine transferase (SPINDLY family)
MESFSKQGACQQVHDHWKDCLARDDFKTIPELNSLKGPLVQVSKLAKEANEAAITTVTNFDEILQEAKKGALRRMIEIKHTEVKALKSLCDKRSITNRLHNEWQQVAKLSTTTPEHMAILDHYDCVSRLVTSLLSIGQNSLQQTAIAKQNKLKKRSEADTNKTDLAGNRKEIEGVFKELLKRDEQSKRDRQKTSKKGKGRAGPPSKTKNQKTGQDKVQKKKPRTPQKNRKGKGKGTSTKRRQQKP